MELILYRRLGTFSRRVLVRRTQPNAYTPRRHLLKRLSRETGMTMGQVWEQLEVERAYLLSQDTMP
jgi:AraC-like DNA-binding protein